MRSGVDGPLYNAMRKYGEDNFKLEVVEEIDPSVENSYDLLNSREIYWIQYYNSTDRNFGYNILIGGDVNRMFSPNAK